MHIFGSAVNALFFALLVFLSLKQCGCVYRGFVL